MLERDALPTLDENTQLNARSFDEMVQDIESVTIEQVAWAAAVIDCLDLAQRPVTAVNGPDTLDPRTVMRWVDQVAPTDRVAGPHRR